MTRTRRFPNDPSAVRAARRFARDALAAHPAETLEVVELLVSELAANSVRHTSSGFEVRVSADARRIRVSVTDHGAGRPEVRPIDPSALSGRGLALVETLASSWGISASRSRSGGKSVWFELQLEQRGRRPRLAA